MKKVWSGLAIMVIIFSIGVIPQQILGQSGSYSWVTPQTYAYSPQITCSGVVSAENGIRLTTGANIIVKELCTSGGSYVREGQLLALTEQPQPQQTFLSQSLGSPAASIPDTGELQSLAEQYGFTLPSGENGDAEDVLEQQSVSIQQATAPISGVVTWENVTPGLFLPAGSALCTILDTASYKAVVQVPSQEAIYIQVGAQAVVTGSEIDGQQVYGTVRSVSNTVSRSVSVSGYSATVDVEIALEAEPHSLRHGVGVDCSISIGEEQQLLTLPYEAIHQDGKNREYIYIAEGERLRKQYITTGVELDDRIEVISGLGTRDTVVTGAPDEPKGRFILKQN